MRNLPAAMTAILALTPTAALAQEWVVERDIEGTDRCVDSAATADGGLLLAGQSGPSSSPDFSILKLDAQGGRAWEQRIDGPAAGQDLLSDLEVGPGGDLVVTGRAQTHSRSSDFFTAKLDGQTGAVVWTQTADRARGIDQANAVAVGADGSVAVTGLGYSSGGDADVFTVLYDAAGTERWRSTFSGPGPLGFANDHGRDVAIDGQGDVLVTGFSPASNGIDDFITLKYSGADGSLLWQRRYTGAGANDVGEFIAVDGEGDVYVCGRSSQSGWKVVVLKYRGRDGDVAWERLEDPGWDDRPTSFGLLDDGSFAITIVSDPDADSSNINDDVFVAVRDCADGARRWGRRFGSDAYNHLESPQGFSQAPNGNLLIACSRIVLGASTDTLLLEMRAADGAILCLAGFDGSRHDADSAQGVHALDDGSVLLAGTTAGFGGGDQDFLAMRYTDDDVVLSLDRATLRDGDEVRLDLCPGVPGAPALVAVVMVNGVPSFTPLLFSHLNARGRSWWRETVPPGLSSLQIDLQGYTWARSGRTVASRPIRLTIQ